MYKKYNIPSVSVYDDEGLDLKNKLAKIEVNREA